MVDRPQFMRDVISDTWYPAKDLPVILERKENLKGIEIGVSHGGTTHYLLESLPNSHIIGIDPYEVYSQMFDTEQSFETFKKLMKLYPDRITFIQSTSDEAVDKIEDESVDFIFVDGYHSNEQVKKDIENYYSKLKSGGLMSGHDYTGWSLQPSVDEKAADYGKTVLTCESDCWYWWK